MPTLNDLLTVDEYSSVSKFYNTPGAVNWTIKVHGTRLARVGAVVRVRGRNHILPERFEAEMLRILTEEQGTRDAA